MKKIFIIIAIVSILGIALFFFYLPKSKERNDIYYRSILDYENIVYKSYNGIDLTLDIILPKENVYSKTPVVIYIHGGDFDSGEKSDLTTNIKRPIIENILDSGYAIVSVGYRLISNDIHFPEPIVDVKDAIRFLRKSADNYGFDSNNYGLWGEGAGAYIALTAGYSSSGVFYGDTKLVDYSSDVNYVIDFGGPIEIGSLYNLETMSTSDLLKTQDKLNMMFGPDKYNINDLSEADYVSMKTYDPSTFVSVDTIPSLIIHGTLDELVNINQPDILETKLKEYNLVYEYKKILGGEHDLNNISTDEINRISTIVVNFIESHNINNND